MVEVSVWVKVDVGVKVSVGVAVAGVINKFALAGQPLDRVTLIPKVERETDNGQPAELKVNEIVFCAPGCRSFVLV